MTSHQQYTVATAAQLVGRNTRIRDRSESIQPHKFKPALKNKRSPHVEKSPEGSKAVRFTPSTKGSTYDHEVGTFHESNSGLRPSAGPQSSVHAQDSSWSRAAQGASVDQHYGPDQTMGVISHHPDGSVTRNGPDRRLKRIHRRNDTAPSVRLDMSRLSPINEHTNVSMDPDAVQIYFAPVDLDRSSTYLSSPREAFQAGLTEANFQFDPGKSARMSLTTLPYPESSNEKFDLTFAQLDQLISALIKSPLIRNRVHRHWWDDTAESTAILDLDGTSTSSSRTESSFHSISTLDSIHQYEDELESPVLGYTSQSLRPHPDNTSRITIVDPRTQGSPVLLFSPVAHSFSAAGSCTFLNLPYGSNIQSTVRMDHAPKNASSSSSSAKVTLQIISRILDRKTGRRKILLVSEFDLTPAARAAALAEFGAQIGRSADEIAVGSPTAVFSPPLSSSPSLSSSSGSRTKTQRTDHHRTAPTYTSASTSSFPPSSSSATDHRIPEEKHAHADDDEVDWIALADTLQQTADTADLVDGVAAALTRLRIRSASSRPYSDADETGMTGPTRAFLTCVDRLRDAVARFWVLRPGSQAYASGVPRSMGAPWVSTSLYEDLGEGADEEGMMAALMERVAKAGVGGCHEFVERVRGEMVRFVPLFAGGEMDGRAGAWVCFLQGREMNGSWLDVT